MNIKKIISEMNTRRENLINRERKLAEKEAEFNNFKETYQVCEEELKQKESELNSKIDKLNDNYKHYKRTKELLNDKTRKLETDKQLISDKIQEYDNANQSLKTRESAVKDREKKLGLKFSEKKLESLNLEGMSKEISGKEKDIQ